MSVPLTYNLIPVTCWNRNVRTILGKEVWDKVRRKVYRVANYRCEICGGKGDKWPVECHEEWVFKDGVQVLDSLIALCPLCHKAKHFGRTREVESDFVIKRVIEHIMNLNNWSYYQVMINLERENDIARKRSELYWEININLVYILL